MMLPLTPGTTSMMLMQVSKCNAAMCMLQCWKHCPHHHHRNDYASLPAFKFVKTVD